MGSAIDLTGQAFGRLTVIRLAPAKKKRLWELRCQCGNITWTTATLLRSGKTKSCGCIRKEKARERVVIHGECTTKAQSPEHRAYCSAKARCNNPNNAKYYRYGARGIKFCFTSFSEFLCVVGRKPSPQHSLNRIDNDGHYEKGNLEWATKSAQANNRRTNSIVMAFGQSLTVAQWSRETGISASAIRTRLRSNYCGECSVSLAKSPYANGCPHNGGTLRHSIATTGGTA